MCSGGTHRASLTGGFVAVGSRMTARRNSSHIPDICRASPSVDVPVGDEVGVEVEALPAVRAAEVLSSM